LNNFLTNFFSLFPLFHFIIFGSLRLPSSKAFCKIWRARLAAISPDDLLSRTIASRTGAARPYSIQMALQSEVEAFCWSRHRAQRVNKKAGVCPEGRRRRSFLPRFS